MILSVSRRTDIPNYYSEWFYNRLKAGFLYVRNPKKNIIIPVFQELSGIIGPERVIWRYDPILFNEVYTPEYHIQAFGQIAKALQGYTYKCVISFVDQYAKNFKNMQELHTISPEHGKLIALAEILQKTARKYGMATASCAESIDLSSCGIEHNCCIDKKLIERITGCRLKAAKDKNQRSACGCLESIDVGTYNTCLNGCRYCYANYNYASVQSSVKRFDSDSPLLCGQIYEGDNITVRAVKSWKEAQLTLFGDEI